MPEVDNVVERLRSRFAIWREVKRLSLTCQERFDIEREVETLIAALQSSQPREEVMREALEMIRDHSDCALAQYEARSALGEK